MLVIGSRFTLASFLVAGLSLACMAEEAESVTIDERTGLTVDAADDWVLVNVHCGSCHSGRLLAQHRLDREGWLKAIRRMQSKENLWDLGKDEATILDYLTTFYGASEERSKHRARRAPLNQPPIQSADEPATETETDDTENEDEDDTGMSESESLPENG